MSYDDDSRQEKEAQSSTPLKTDTLRNDTKAGIGEFSGSVDVISSREKGMSGNNRNQLKVPLPIFVASLAKSGTTSIHRYFKCGHQRSFHKYVKKGSIGECIRKNVADGKKKVFDGCGRGPKSVFTDNSAVCYDPSVWDLEAIYNSYPNSTIMLGTRDSHRWLDSVERYKFGKWSLLSSWINCNDALWPTLNYTSAFNSTGNGDYQRQQPMTKEDIRQFYLWHQNHVRKFAKEHPSMTFIDFRFVASSS